ncbi:MAG: hypothetical protein SFU99_17195 [Saprospiraceae bacterium]|nr:hypothetical protein [Saprospiraceae bacterium]
MRTTLIFLILSLISNILIAQNTRFIVRAKAKDAKFIGTSLGSALILVKNVETDEILAKGFTEGSTGNTQRIMNTPHQRFETLSDEQTAKFETTLALDEPTFVTIEAHSPYAKRGARVMASTQMWLIPGKDIIGDGIVLEIPGFIIDILHPHTHRYMKKADLKNGILNVEANIVMMCGCIISKGGLWDGSKMEVNAILKLNGEKQGEYPLQITDTENLFTGDIPLTQSGNYEIILYAYDARSGNTGVEKVNFILQ